MNFRTTIILIVLLALVVGIGVVYTKNRSNRTPDVVSAPRPDFFYLVDDDDIKRVEVSHQGKKVKFVQDTDGKWHFDTLQGEPVFMERWGGVTLLLSGPQYRRIISENAPDLARYGLNNPTTTISVGLPNNRGEIEDVVIKAGDKTPDGDSQYVLFRNDKAVYIVDSSWGDVISRLVTEPPKVPTPVPTAPPATPEGTPAATPQASPAGSPAAGATGTPARA